MQTGHLSVALLALGALGASPAWGSVEPTGKIIPSAVASFLPTAAQPDQFRMLNARASHPFSEIILVAFADDKDKKEKPPPPPPPKSAKCPPGHGGDDQGHGNDGHDCRVDK
jgi:hypothetical protein